MARGQFAGKISFKIEGNSIDEDGSRRTRATYELSADICAHHGMGKHDLLSGWVIRSINGRKVLLASYDDDLLNSLVQLIVRATNRKDKLSIPIKEMMRSQHESQEGQACRTEGSPCPV